MMRNSLLSVVVIGTVWLLGVEPAQAQFGGFFGGSKVETIGTKELVQLLSQQRKIVQEAQQNGQPNPPA